MKRHLLSVLLFVIPFAGIAQVDFGFFAGPQATSSRYTIRNEKQENDFKYGFQAGVLMKVPFEGNLYFAPAAFYSLKGYKVKYTQFLFPPDAHAIDNNTTMHTFELAAMLQYDLGKGANHAFIKVGPSLDFQLFGEETFNLMDGGQVNRDMTFNYTNYGRYAANMIMQFGFESAGGFLLFAQYSHGMGSLNNADGGPKIRHRVYGLSIGKFLRKKKIVIDTRNRE